MKETPALCQGILHNTLPHPRAHHHLVDSNDASSVSINRTLAWTQLTQSLPPPDHHHFVDSNDVSSLSINRTLAWTQLTQSLPHPPDQHHFIDSNDVSSLSINRTLAWTQLTQSLPHPPDHHHFVDSKYMFITYSLILQIIILLTLTEMMQSSQSL